MNIDRNGNIYDGDLAPGDRIATEEEVSAWNANLARAVRREEIVSLLLEIDQKSIRPLRDGEPERVAELKAQAEALREELRTM